MSYPEDGDEKGGEWHVLQLERVKESLCSEDSVLVSVYSTKKKNTESVTFSKQARLLRKG